MSSCCNVPVPKKSYSKIPWYPKIPIPKSPCAKMYKDRKYARMSTEPKGTLLKVRQSQSDFFKATFLPKNEWTNLTLLLWYLRSACFVCFLEEIKDIKNHFEINWPSTRQNWNFLQFWECIQVLIYIFNLDSLQSISIRALFLSQLPHL